MKAPKAVVEGLVYEVPLRELHDKDLVALSDASGIGLSLEEMRRVQAHFRALGRDPRDIELEALGQAWSEHCCYKSSRAHLKRTVFGIQEDRILAREDAGVAAFDGEYAYVLKIESHNHPSAIEPYGGAATGVGGVLRDVACMGAQPVALVDPLFFGPPGLTPEELPKGTKHPLYLLSGVVAGIRDYGNRVGIPTLAGMVAFHPQYVANPIVNVGCVGIMKKADLVHSWVGNEGDVFVLLGGLTGRDGIHGVTFASADLHEASEEEDRGAVQLGDPITKEPLIHAVIEANEGRILTGMKDLGGGGLSCVCGEMARDAGLGVEVDLEKIRLKEPGMKPWEIWVSESQERMMVTVRPERLERLLSIMREWDVPATPIARAVRERIIRVRWHGTPVFEMDGNFLYEGPVYERPAKMPEVAAKDAKPKVPAKLDRVLIDVLAHPNVASKAFIIRRYDHEVRGRTAVKPLVGVLGRETHGDATVLKPVEKSWRGLALTADVGPALTWLDPYWGTCSAIDEVARNLAAVGARLDSLADCLNFANPERPEEMGKLIRACEALRDGATALAVPYLSGNVSLYNHGPRGPIPPTPTLLGVGIVRDVRRATTAEFKAAGGALYLVGAPTRDEMGGSVLYDVLGAECTIVPRTDFGALKTACEAVVSGIEAGLVAACHDVSTGGVATALAEMAIGAGLGFQVRFAGSAPARVTLFSESNTRWVVEARDPKALEGHLRAAGVHFERLGEVGGDVLAFHGKDFDVEVPFAKANDAWTDGLARWFA